MPRDIFYAVRKFLQSLLTTVSQRVITVLRQVIQFIKNADHEEGDCTMISLNYRAPGPIYEQIKDNLRRLILSGAIAEGEKLPSVRELAGELAINPNTIMRAYRELEAEGYVYTVQGKGCFAGKLSQVDTGRRDKLLEAFRNTAGELLSLGITSDTLKSIIAEERKNRRNDL